MRLLCVGLIAFVLGFVLLGLAINDRVEVERRLDRLTETQGHTLGKLERQAHGPGEGNLRPLLDKLRRQAKTDAVLRDDVCAVYRQMSGRRCQR
jgi:hypothetical protein